MESKMENEKQKLLIMTIVTIKSRQIIQIVITLLLYFAGWVPEANRRNVRKNAPKK